MSPVELDLVGSLLSLLVSAGLLHDISLNIQKLHLETFLKVVQASFPVVRFQALCALLAADQGAHDEHVSFRVNLAAFFWIEHSIVVAHEAELCRLGILMLLLHHAIKRVAHNGNQHVKEYNLREESGEDEQHVAQHFVWVTAESICLELAQSEHVLVVNQVEDEKVEDGLNNHTVVYRVLAKLKRKHGGTDHRKRNHEEHQELDDVSESPLDQLDEEGGPIE